MDWVRNLLDGVGSGLILWVGSVKGLIHCVCKWQRHFYISHPWILSLGTLRVIFPSCFGSSPFYRCRCHCSHSSLLFRSVHALVLDYNTPDLRSTWSNSFVRALAMYILDCSNDAPRTSAWTEKEHSEACCNICWVVADRNSRSLYSNWSLIFPKQLSSRAPDMM